MAAGRRCRSGHRCPIPWFRGRIHDQGRPAAEATTGVGIPFVESVPGGGADFADSAGQFIDGYRGSMVALAPIASDVDADVVRAVEARQAEAVAGTFLVSSGSVNDQDGYEAVAAGEALEDGAMLGMEFFVHGAIGTPG
ncbi:MAG: hypothetical protein QGI28_08020 [Acidimicrobiales bacterium]|nr:hypothetical protein [Acidimicrobiales bacterium]